MIQTPHLHTKAQNFVQCYSLSISLELWILSNHPTHRHWCSSPAAYFRIYLASISAADTECMCVC